MNIRHVGWYGRDSDAHSQARVVQYGCTLGVNGLAMEQEMTHGNGRQSVHLLFFVPLDTCRCMAIENVEGNNDSLHNQAVLV